MLTRFFPKLVITLFLALLFALCPTPVFAAANFTTDYHVNYTVLPSGTTHTQINITLTNTTAQYYASSYKMQLGFEDIQNINVSDSNGSIKPVLTKNENGYTVELAFNKKSVGTGSKLPFVISFDTATIAKKYGKIWEINIPGIANSEDFQAFTVDVQVPASFGKPTYIKPNQNTNTLTFSKEQLGKSGISIAYGTQQQYEFNLTYHLKNGNFYPVSTEIALPPSTNYQDVYITNINPKPVNVTQDKDGNWLAQYRLLPSQKVDVQVSGKAKVQYVPKKQELTADEKAQYLAEKPFWNVSSNEIRELADELQTPEAIYNYVVKTLNYDFTRVTEDKPRLGALNALKNQNSAVCREYTDLFIAIARAAKIPAREVDGFAYTENPKQRPVALVRDILHVWPEYYDENQKTWIMVDPTWGNTTGGVDYFTVLDFDHFAFVIKGLDSTYPIPAGDYKTGNDKVVKDVAVHFTQSLPDDTPHLGISSSLPKIAIAGLPITGKIDLTNTGPNYISSQILYITSDSLEPQNQMYTIQGIPPLGTTSIDVGFKGETLLTNKKAAFTIRLASVTNTQSLEVKPFFMTVVGIGGMILFALLTVCIHIFTRKSRRIRFSR